jgi:hypothetical protein
MIKEWKQYFSIANKGWETRRRKNETEYRNFRF